MQVQTVPPWNFHNSNRSVILWTRLTPPSGTQNRPAFLDYCVSKDQKFKSCVSRGTTITDGAVDFTAKVRSPPIRISDGQSLCSYGLTAHQLC